MEMGDCHVNSAKLINENPGKYRWVTGYAFIDFITVEGVTSLSGDNWAYHSWLIDDEGNIIETTIPREIYFGRMDTLKEQEARVRSLVN